MYTSNAMDMIQVEADGPLTLRCAEHGPIAGTTYPTTAIGVAEAIAEAMRHVHDAHARDDGYEVTAAGDPHRTFLLLDGTTRTEPYDVDRSAHPYRCPVCGKRYRTPEHAAGCADDDRGRAR